MTTLRAMVTLAVATTLLLAGCTGTLVAVQASPATVPDAAFEPLGYVHANTTAVPLTYPVGVAGLTRDVTVTSYVSGYSKPSDDGEVAALVLLSTPNVDVGGQSVNPFAHLSNRELTTQVLSTLQQVRDLSEYGEIGDLREVDSQKRTVLGSDVDVVTYAGTATADGEVTDVRFVVASVEHGHDVVTAVGVYDADADEADSLASLIERIEHADGADQP